MAKQTKSHQIRQQAIQALYQLIVYSDTKMQAPSKEEAMHFALYAGSDSNDDGEVLNSYLITLVNGVTDHQQTLDDKLKPYLRNWTIDRLARVDLLILRLALYELFHEEVPPLVVVDEAIELAKDFSDEKARRFITGVLGNVVKDYELTDDPTNNK